MGGGEGVLIVERGEMDGSEDRWECRQAWLLGWLMLTVTDCVFGTLVGETLWLGARWRGFPRIGPLFGDGLLDFRGCWGLVSSSPRCRPNSQLCVSRGADSAWLAVTCCGVFALIWRSSYCDRYRSVRRKQHVNSGVVEVVSSREMVFPLSRKFGNRTL